MSPSNDLLWAGVKAYDQWRTAHPEGETVSQGFERLCPPNLISLDFERWSAGWNRAMDLMDTETHLDTTQMTYDEVDDATRPT